MEPIRIELPTGWAMGSVNAYLFTHPEVILVDAGVKSDECWNALVDGLAARGVAVPDISRVVITHPHVDHFGLARRITAESDATVWICDLGVPWLLATGGMWDDRSHYYRDHFLKGLGLPPEDCEKIVLGMQELATLAEPVPEERIVPFRPDGTLQMGGLGWRSIHAPGHASMQTVFYQSETRQLLSADMLLATTPAPVIEQPPEGEEQREPGLPLFLRSLDALESLEIDTVYPGHGRPFGNHRQVIARQRERIWMRKAECLALVREGRSAIPELLEAMYAYQPPAARLAGLWMLIGYLDLLLADGLVREEDIDGVYRYSHI